MSAPATLQHDLTPAQWVIDRLHWPPGGLGPFLVRSFVPAVFDAYARVLNRCDGRRWAEVAADFGTTVARDTVWADIVGASASHTGPRPEDGLLDRESLAALAGVLESATTTPGSIWMALWDGHGDLDLPFETPRFAYGPAEPLVEAPTDGLPAGPGWAPYPGLAPSPFRAYFLFHGSLDAVRAFPGSAGLPPYARRLTPNIWWPDDHAWCVATELDGYSTFVGGSRTLIDAILAGPALEAWPADPDDPPDPGPYERVDSGA